MAPESGITEKYLSVLQTEDKNIVWYAMARLESPEFEFTDFTDVCRYLQEYLSSDEFLGESKRALFFPGLEMALSNPEVKSRLQKLDPCRRASLICHIIFNNSKFHRVWNIVNASKIQSVFEDFSTQLNNTNTDSIVNLEMYLTKAIKTLTRNTNTLQTFPIIHSKVFEGTIVTKELMELFGFLVIASEDSILVFHDDTRRIVFAGKGIITFQEELRRLIRHAVANNLNIKEFVGSQFQKGGMIHKMMRMNLSDFRNTFATTDVRNYEQSMKMLETKEATGSCPAVLPLEGSEERLSIAESIANVIIDNIPSRFLLNANSEG